MAEHDDSLIRCVLQRSVGTPLVSAWPQQKFRQNRGRDTRWSGSNDRDGYEPSGDSYCSRDSSSRGVEQPMRGCDRRYDAPDSVDACRAPPVEGGVSPAGPLGWAETRTFAIGRMSLSQREADDHSFPRGSRPGEAAPLKGFEPTHEVRVEVGVGLDGGCTMQPCPLDRGIEQ